MGLVGRASDPVLLVVVALSLAAGVVLRVLDLGARALTLDEGYTWALAQRPLAGMIGLFTYEANGTLYPALLWPLLRLSESEAAIRSPALVFGIAAVPATYFAARVMLRDGHAALFASVLLAASPLAIHFSQEAKGHALAMALVPLSYGLLAVALRQGSGFWWTLYGVSLVLTAYASATALLAFAGHPLMALAVGVYLRRWLMTVGVSTVALIPLIYLFARSAGVRDSLYWEREPTLGEAARVLGQLAVGEAAGVRVGHVALLVIIAALVSVAGAFASHSRSTVRKLGVATLVPVVAWCVLPFALLLAISLVKPIFDVRYLGISLPAACVLGGFLLASVSRRVALPAVALVVVAMSVASISIDYTTTDHRTAGSWLSTRSHDGEPVLVIPVEQLPALAYYDPSLRGEDGRAVVEEWGDVLPRRVVSYKLSGGYGDAPPAPPSMTALERLAESGTFFGVTYAGSLGDRGEAWLAARCEVDRAPLAQLRVERYRC